MKRLKEASTWAGIGVLLQVAVSFAPPQYQIILHGMSAAAAAVAGVVPEQAAL